jgi:V8-like Glu-specific endopeptidase
VTSLINSALPSTAHHQYVFLIITNKLKKKDLAFTAKMDERVKQVAKEDAERVRALAAQAYHSRAWLYPFKVRTRTSIATVDDH